jgi:hypothetical protein
MANDSKVNSSEGKMINGGTLLLELVNEKIRSPAEIRDDMDQANNYNNYRLGLKPDGKILVKLYLEKVEKQTQELRSSELVQSIRRLIDLTDYHILGNLTINEIGTVVDFIRDVKFETIIDSTNSSITILEPKIETK